ncbi:MAG: hypothetical protein IPI23_21985 [Bacteroidetes bacterium]|nr:hypothetical protein [Bacteroidota bacterium]
MATGAIDLKFSFYNISDKDAFHYFGSNFRNYDFPFTWSRVSHFTITVIP